MRVVGLIRSTKIRLATNALVATFIANTRKSLVVASTSARAGRRRTTMTSTSPAHSLVTDIFVRHYASILLTTVRSSDTFTTCFNGYYFSLPLLLHSQLEPVYKIIVLSILYPSPIYIHDHIHLVYLNTTPYCSYLYVKVVCPNLRSLVFGVSECRPYFAMFSPVRFFVHSSRLIASIMNLLCPFLRL